MCTARTFRPTTWRCRVSSIVVKIGTKAAEAARDPKWVEKLAIQASEKITDPRYKDFAEAGSRVLLKHKDQFAGWSADRLIDATTWLSIGEVSKAEEAWLRTASHDDLLDRLDANAAATQKNIADRKARWNGVKEALLEFLKVAGPIAIQMLLVAL
jgi:hypothetical protein